MAVAKAKKQAKKKVGRPRKVRTPKADKFELFLKSIAERFPDDPTAPGIALAWLPNTSQFYVALRRFKYAGGQGSIVYLKAYEPKLIDAMNEVVRLYKIEICKVSATEAFLRS